MAFLVRLLCIVLLLSSCLKSKKGGTESPPVQDGEDSPAELTPAEPILPTETPAPALVEKPNCKKPQSAKSFRMSPPAGQSVSLSLGLADIQSELNSACQSCHLAPASATGGFSYQNSYKGSEIAVGESKKHVDGFFEAAEKMRDALLKGDMPPDNKNPEAYIALGKKLDRWIAQNKPEQAEEISTVAEYPRPMWGLLDDMQISDLGNCMVDDKPIGTDPITDYYFEQAETLPKVLSETDLSSMDTEVLATKGTVAYNVEYPLWNDHAQKQRFIHQPAIIKAGRTFKPKPLEIVKKDRNSEPVFTIPENTRFYKSFFRGVKEADGSIRYRPVETRIIVVRNAPRTALYGTYVWKEDGSDAELLTTPYRDGTPWKDLTLTLDFNRLTGTKRKYLVPAKHRCEQCHRGAPGENFVLGFTPLQINRRDVGEAGRDLPVGFDELTQVPRFVKYGMLTDVTAAQLPKLEYFPATHLLDDHVVRAQGYMLGNCSHCHNPKGFAKQEANISMNLSAGRIFDFDTNLTSSFFANKKLVNHEGKLDQSYLFHRVADKDSELKLEMRMPLHSIGGPDCRASTLFSRWIKTYDPSISNFEVNSFNPGVACNLETDFDSGDINFLEQDPTDSNGPYRPRREDWEDPTAGMSAWFKELRNPPALQKVSLQKYAVDWWQVKAECTFPPVPADTVALKDWMLKPDKITPARPLGQLYWTTPGAYFYNLTCVKCHGRLGEADGPLASNLDKWSGGTIRVANFPKGLFNEINATQFMRALGSEQVDYRGNYFIWMAYEGTKMNPPPQVAELLGSNKAQMLKTIVDRCARQIPSNPKATKSYFRDYDIFQDTCTFDNWPTTDPRLQYDLDTGLPLHPEDLNTWLRKAASNTGWAIFEYVRTQIAVGKQQFPQSECESEFKP